MGKYSNVNATSLKNTVTTAINELSTYSMNSIRSNLVNIKNLSSKAGSNITSAITTITGNKNYNGTIPNLRDYLYKLSNAADNIIKYQNLEKEIANLESELYTYDKEGNKVINNWVARQLSIKKNNLSSCELTIDKLLA